MVWVRSIPYTTNEDIWIMKHAIYSLVFQVALAFITGNWWYGFIIASAFYFGREHAQAEYRIIKDKYRGKRANMPWYGGFMPVAWTKKSVLDFLLPLVITGATAWFMSV